MASLSRFLEKKLKLKVNQGKSAVARPGKRKFLGFSFTSGSEPKRRIAPQALERFKLRVRELTRTGRHLAPAHLVNRLKLFLTGWLGYFGFCETPSVLGKLDSWLRRRLIPSRNHKVIFGSRRLQHAHAQVENLCHHLNANWYQDGVLAAMEAGPEPVCGLAPPGSGS